MSFSVKTLTILGLRIWNLVLLVQIMCKILKIKYFLFGQGAFGFYLISFFVNLFLFAFIHLCLHQIFLRISIFPPFIVLHSRVGRNNAVDDAIGPANARHKIVVMGAAKVGKTSIITQFLYNTFTTKYKRTIEEMHQGNFSIAGVSLTLDILDTAGSYEVSAYMCVCGCAKERTNE